MSDKERDWTGSGNEERKRGRMIKREIIGRMRK